MRSRPEPATNGRAASEQLETGWLWISLGIVCGSTALLVLPGLSGVEETRLLARNTTVGERLPIFGCLAVRCIWVYGCAFATPILSWFLVRRRDWALPVSAWMLAIYYVGGVVGLAIAHTLVLGDHPTAWAVFALAACATVTWMIRVGLAPSEKRVDGGESAFSYGGFVAHHPLIHLIIFGISDGSGNDMLTTVDRPEGLASAIRILAVVYYITLFWSCQVAVEIVTPWKKLRFRPAGRMCEVKRCVES